MDDQQQDDQQQDDQQQDDQQQDDQQQDDQQQDDQQQDDQQQDDQQQDEQQQDDQQSFSRDYVQSLRSESAGYRKRMQAAERALFAARVEATGLIVSPDEVEYDPALLNDESALTERVQEIIDAKPYLKRRTVSGDIGQHEQKLSDNDGGGLMSMLQRGA